MSNSIMILGTASSVGKSTVATALCRYLKKNGYNVAPFKSLNISLNSGVTKQGEEIGRAQLVQAEACEIIAEGLMNPVLIKPSVNKKTQVIVNGKVYCDMENCDYNDLNRDLKSFVKEAYENLSDKYDNIVIEGSGSCCEINLKDTDIANFYTAKITNSDVILVGDIDKGGIFASIYGTVMLLEEDERKRIKGVIINKFRGDLESFKPALKQLEELIKIPVLGVLPYEDLDIEDEDSVTERLRSNKKSGLNIAIIKLPHMSNFTDFYPLELEKNINIRYVKTPKELEGANLIIIPGSKNTIYDLESIKENGLFDKILELHKDGSSIMGICGGFQMLGNCIIDALGVEGEKRIIDGFDLLPLKTKFASDKKTSISKGIVCSMENELKEISNVRVYGYEIHNGSSEMIDGQGEVLIIDNNSNVIGISNTKGDVLGTYIHGIFEGTEFRHKLLNHFKDKYNVIIENSFEEKENYKKYKLKQYDKLCSTFEKNIDADKVLEILYGKKVKGENSVDD
ncbi:MAG: cobyric acid synthase [Clostridium sp.]|uniref:cobyric acid synthase n=1 Tax=Clostridium sp. TaxID=1506 RepID=UPI002FC845E7